MPPVSSGRPCWIPCTHSTNTARSIRSLELGLEAPLTRAFFRLFVVSCSALSLGTGDLSSPQLPVRDGVQLAHQFLRALYPDLKGRGLVFDVRADAWRPYDGPAFPLLAFGLTIV